jgi:competence protein ComEC
MSDSDGEILALHVRLLNDPVVKEKSVKLFVETEEWKDTVSWKASDEKMIVYLAREEFAEKLKYGDEIIIHASPSLVEGPKNPDEFDYRLWLERQGVRRQVYAKGGEWKFVADEKGNWFKNCALDLRRYFLGKLQVYGLSGSSFGVAAALLLGASDYLDPGTIQAYSASGTLHVLSVSGMHVALVYVVLLKLLAPLQKRRWGKWVSVIIQLVFLWFYATLTGLCPSVLRSVTMLSVVIAGRAFNKNAHILNSLAASALILLLINPLMLFDIGFQLSYLAVGGIVTLQPQLEKMWSPESWLMKQIWVLLSVTLVAQIFTFPLGLYYFKQFPTYFLLSNFVVIPLSTITMYAGLFLLIVSPIAFIAKPIAVVFKFLVELLNGSVTAIEHLPHAVIYSAKWEKPDLFLLYIFIVSALIFLLRKKRIILQIGLASFLLLLFSVAYGKNNSFRKKEIVIFNVNHSSAIAIVNGNDHVLFTDTALAKRKGDIDFHIEPFLKANGMDEDKIVPIYDSLHFKNYFVDENEFYLEANGKQIVLVGKNFHDGKLNSKGAILLMRENSNQKLDSLISRMNPSLIVADGSDSKWKIKKWKEICGKRNVKFYDVADSGALVIEEE